MESEKASPLPEGRADGRACLETLCGPPCIEQAGHAVLHRTAAGETFADDTYGRIHPAPDEDPRLMVGAEALAAPVVGGTGGGAMSEDRPCPGCGADRGDQLCCDACWARVPTRVPGVDRPWRTYLRASRQVRAWGRMEDIYAAVRAWLAAHPAVPVGVQPATEAATSATDRAVPTRPEPAEDPGRCPACGHAKHGDWCPNLASDNECSCAKAAVPVVHPEPASESSDSVAELVADTTRSGDRADDVVMRAAQALMDRWEDGRDPTRCHLHIESEDPRTVAQVAVAAAVAAVRADLARQIHEMGRNEAEDGDHSWWNDALIAAARLVEGGPS